MVFSVPKSITREEAQRAIYLDFECNKDQSPSFAGTIIDDKYQATLLEDVFKPAATSKNFLQQDLSEFAQKILKLAQTEDRVVVAWSKHELGFLIEPTPEIEPLYRDANKLVLKFFRDRRKSTIKKLNNQINKVKTEGLWRNNKVGLKDLLQLDYVNYEYPKHLKSFSPGKALREMRKQLIKKDGNYKKIAPGVKRAFSKMISYNEHDCRGMIHMIDYVFSRNPADPEIGY
jgi:hypothetical protein